MERKGSIIHCVRYQLYSTINFLKVLFITSVFPIGICATSEAIILVLVLYLLVPHMGDYTVVMIHCKPWGENHWHMIQRKALAHANMQNIEKHWHPQPVGCKHA